MERPTFTKLRGRENFDVWKTAAKSYLIIKGLWEVIDKDISPEDSPETNAKAIREITLIIEQTPYNYIEDSDSARTVWDKLCKAFDDSGIARKVSILNQLVSIKMKDHRSIEKYVNEILLYWQKSKIAGFKIEEQVIASLLLGGLPDEYRAMILGIENSGHDLTVDYVKTVLLQGIPDLGIETGEEQAFAVMRGNKKYHGDKYKNTHGKAKGKNRKACFKCGSFFHFMAKCPKAQLTCYGCGDIKHLIKNCTKKRVAMIALFNSTMEENNMKDNWYIDSGASAHMTNNRNLFVSMKESTNKEIIIKKNGYLQQKGMQMARS